MKKILPSDYNFDKVHIIGNGPSADLFDHSDGTVVSLHVPLVKSDILCSNRPQYYGYFGIPTIYCHALSIHSVYAKKIFKKGQISTIVKELAFMEWTVYCLNEDIRTPFNTGHRAYLWVQHQKPREVHLWGFDSIWNSKEYNHKDSFTQVLEQRINEKPRNIDNERQSDLADVESWHNFWHHILQSNTKVHK